MKITVNVPPLAFQSSALAKQKFQATFTQEMHNTTANILSNINSGRDPQGASLKPYSPAYEKKKVDSGRSSTVNLNWTGEFHRSFQVRETREGGGSEIFLAGTHATDNGPDISNAQLAEHLAAGGRDVMFYGDRDIERITRAVEKVVDSNLASIVKIGR